MGRKRRKGGGEARPGELQMLAGALMQQRGRERSPPRAWLRLATIRRQPGVLCPAEGRFPIPARDRDGAGPPINPAIPLLPGTG